MSIRYKVKAVFENLRRLFLTRDQRLEEYRREAEARMKERVDRINSKPKNTPPTGPVVDDRDICEGFLSTLDCTEDKKEE